MHRTFVELTKEASTEPGSFSREWRDLPSGPATLTRAQSVLACRSSHCRQLCPLSTPSSSPHRRRAADQRATGGVAECPLNAGQLYIRDQARQRSSSASRGVVPWPTHCTSTAKTGAWALDHVCFSGDFRESPLRYLGATDEQIAAHRTDVEQWGQGSSQIRLLPNRKNLLRIDYIKL